MAPTPSRVIAILRECAALARALPEIDRTFDLPQVPEKLAARIDHAAARGFVLPVRYAALVLDLLEGDAESLAERVNAPNDCRTLAILAIRDRALLRDAARLDAETLLALLERADVFRRPERLDRLVEVAECDALTAKPDEFAPRLCLQRAAQVARSVDAAAVAREHPGEIPDAIRRARLVALADLQNETARRGGPSAETTC
jgi:tRNA nucleotidyltransferase (CCA-adding enzyme)